MPSPTDTPAPSLITLEVSNQCSKGCWFCYNGSGPDGDTVWNVAELTYFGRDLAHHGVRALALSGGEPLEFGGLVEAVADLSPLLSVSITTNGLLLTNRMIERLAAAGLRRVILSIHFPEKDHEVARVAELHGRILAAGLGATVNLLVARSRLVAARRAMASLVESGVPRGRIVLLPMRLRDTPEPQDLAWVAGQEEFPSMTCLTRCGAFPSHAVVGADRTVAWCAYTTARRPLRALTHGALVEALRDLPVLFCGGTEDGLPPGAEPAQPPSRSSSS